MFEVLTEAGFDLRTRNHASAILSVDFPRETAALVEILANFEIETTELIGGGGGEAVFTQRLRHRLYELGWPKHTFRVATSVDGVQRVGIGHEVDHVMRAEAGTLALEIEWNNKDPFYDRDLESFQRLHVQSAVSVGIIVTRGASLQSAFVRRIGDLLHRDGVQNEADLAAYGVTERTAAQRRSVATMMEGGASFVEAFTQTFVASKYGQSTTHWRKLEERLERGVGNPCPLLLVGLPESCLVG